jgi:hypothetical protein
LALIIFVVSEKKAFEHFPIGSNVNICPKPLGQLKPNCPGMIIGSSFTNFLFFMLIGNPRWPPPQDIDIGTKSLKFVEDHPMNIHVQFGFNHICSF